MVLRTPHVARLLAGALLGRLPSGMAPLALVLWAAQAAGSVAFGGLLSAVYVLASALVQPVKGRLLDRYGCVRTIGPLAAFHAGCLGLLVCGPGADLLSATAAAVVAGACTPPLETSLRTLWPALLAGPEQQRTALGIDIGSQGLLYVAGPLLTSALAAAHGPAAAVAATGLASLAGTLLVLTSPFHRRRAAPAPVPRGGPAAPLPTRDMVTLYLALTGTGAAIGSMNVWAVSAADTLHWPALSGLIPAAFSASAFLGGLAYGRGTRRGVPLRTLRLSAAAFCAGWIPLACLDGPHPGVGAVAAVTVPGLFLTPVVGSAFLALGRRAPACRANEVNAWLVQSMGVGSAIGSLVAGSLAGQPAAGVIVPAAGAAATVVCLVLGAGLGPARPGAPH
ncbi:MFS transporter [Streptomyces sp. NPDC127106]|uniref:MFS transporter n=1 Tax=Streptomyces sp. NPDC127106 TaxID=3345360 RepID=UPI003631CB3D